MERPIVRQADEKGRVRLGKDWAGRWVELKHLSDGTIELRWADKKPLDDFLRA